MSEGGNEGGTEGGMVECVERERTVYILIVKFPVVCHTAYDADK